LIKIGVEKFVCGSGAIDPAENEFRKICHRSPFSNFNKRTLAK